MTMNSRGILSRHIGQFFLNSALILLCVCFLLPLSWCVATSLRNPAESFKMPPSFLPTSFVYQNYTLVFSYFPFFQFMLNSLFVGAMVAFLCLLVSTMAAFSFARIDFRGKNALFILFMSGLMIPSSATMISVYLIMSRVRLVGSLWALILPASINPLYIFLIRQFMMTIPKSYEEAAEIDGCGRLTVYAQIIMPMCKPVMMLAGLQVFISSWNNFIAPLIYLSNWKMMTLPIGLRLLNGYMGTGNISEILAGVSLSLIPPILLFVIGKRYLIEGIALTGVKS